MTRRVLVTGGGGMLARALANRFGSDATLLGRPELDITDANAVRDAVAGFGAVINAAAYTAVDDAESNEDAAFAVNATGARNVAAACAAFDIPLVHVSTDYVFDGHHDGPYREDDPTGPLSAYGRTKLAGELAVREEHPNGVRIVRTAWLYGDGGKNFVATMLDRARAGLPVSVVTDQVGSPTWTHDLAERIELVLDAPAGTYHGTNSGHCSWWEFATAIYELSGADPVLVGQTTSASFIRPAPRPSNSVLADDAARAAGLAAMRPWRDALAEALVEDFAE